MPARAIERMRVERDLEIEVARRTAVHAGAALAAQAQALAVDRAAWNARGEAARVELHHALGTARRLLQREAHRHLVILARERAARAPPPGAPEQPHRFEQLAEVYAVQVLVAPGAETVEPVGRRTEILTRPERAQAVVGRALFLVPQVS